MTNPEIQSAILQRWARSTSCNELILRGGIVTAVWISPEPRRTDDVDFLATYPFDPDRTYTLIDQALLTPINDGLSFEIHSLSTIFEDTPSPGTRLIVVACNSIGESSRIQIDVGYGDAVTGGVIESDIPVQGGNVRLLTPRPEVGYAWKLHGLVEFGNRMWHPKTLADLWLMGRYCPLQEPLLREAIRIAFADRDAPWWSLDRLISRELGTSGKSRRSWAAWRREHRYTNVPESLADAVNEVAKRVEPYWREFRTGDPPRWPTEISPEEMHALVASDPKFTAHIWPDGETCFNYNVQSPDTFLEPLWAPTYKEYRNRQLRREARGVTFDGTKKIIARPFPKFFNLDLEELEGKESFDAFEKLDGSLIFPTPMQGGWKWRTRRGPSAISENVARFVVTQTGNYNGFVEHCLQQEWTPLFEWCSRSRRIVLDHPEDRLVLTAIRENHSGKFLKRDTLEQYANEYQIELVQFLGVISDVKTFASEVNDWKQREGCVLVSPDEHFFKFKSDWYRWHHRAVEGPNRDRARWYLIAQGEIDSLCDVSLSRGIDLQEYAKQVQASFECMSKTCGELLAQFPDRSTDSRRELANQVKGFSGWKRRIFFLSFSGEITNQVLRETIVSACRSENEFQKLVEELGGPRLQDG